MEPIYFECGCRGPHHVIMFEHDEDFPGELTVGVQMNPYLGFWDRLKVGFCYILGIKTKNFHYHWDTTLLEHNEVDKLFVICQQARSIRSKHEQFKASTSSSQRS